ncbi:MAG: hypothetical protein VX529_06675 [Pseudomonadota bacterium]|nr:hypothetical protein [Pseudomonadota bacterium]
MNAADTLRDDPIRLRNIAVAADRRAESLPANDPERAVQRAVCEHAMTRLARHHAKRGA